MIKVAYQGEQGAYSEIASYKLFGNDIKTSPSFSFEEVFSKVKSGVVNFGVIPIENSLYGSVFETYDLLLQNSLYIISEANLQISHCLLANEKYELSQIKKVYSHPQALGQCSVFLKSLKGVQIIPAYDTAGSAVSLKDRQTPSAAVASRRAAEIYGLKVLKSNIQNNQENYTRFLVISKKQVKGSFKNPKTSICFELKSLPGALFRALSVFALRDINLVRIESRPIPHKPFEYVFYVDLSGSIEETGIKNAINHLSEIAISIKSFGSYEAGKMYKS